MSINEYHVLLIDDDEDDFFYLQDLFAEVPRSKYKISWKSTYQEGLQALRDGSFDVCLLDYRLGEQTGIDLLQEVTRVSQTCPIILLTGYGDFDLDVQAMQMGAAEYLVKAQLTSPLLERSVRYAMKHAMDMQELRESKAQILQQDRLASLGLLASSLAHEIGTPLGIIRSRAEMIAKKSVHDTALQAEMNTVVKQIDRIAKLVNSLLNLAREKKSDVAIAVSVDDVVHDVLSLLRPELERQGIELITEIQPGQYVRAEPGPLGQVLLNLLVNSIHAVEESRKNGAASESKISFRVTRRAESVDMIIRDSGAGIPEKYMSQLFKPFFTTKDIGQGTGLGLATSFRLAQSWGGSIQAESPPGQGATFTITLPSSVN